MRIRALLLACLAALTALPSAPAFTAQAAASQKGKIAAIKVTGSRRYTEAQIAAASGLHVGDTASREEIQAAADRLVQLGPFSAVQYHFTSSREDITAVFQVQDAPAMPVSFDNFPWFTDAELADALRQAVEFFDGSAPEQGSILDAMAAALERQLASRGIRARVEHTLLAEPIGDAMMQQFKVVGTSLKIGAIQFGDTLAAESSRVQSALRDLVGKPYSRFEVEVFTNEQVRPLYLARGHLRMRIGQPQARFTGDPNRPLPDTVLVLVSIEPGPVYRWGGVEWLGNAAFGHAALNAFLELKRDDLADGMKIAASWHHVEDEYGRRGYLDIKLKPEPVYDDATQRVSYRVTIDEGRAYRMGELVITGLSLAAENKVREAWRLPQGQVFDRIHFEQFLAMLRKGSEAIFGDLPVHYEQAGHWLRTNAAQGTVDVLLDFK